MIGQKFNSFQNLINYFTPSNCSSNTLYFHNIFHNIIQLTHYIIIYSKTILLLLFLLKKKKKKTRN